DLVLQLQQSVHERFSRGRAARHVDVHRHDAVTATHHRIRIVVVAAAVGTGAHGYDPARLCHLVVHAAQCGGHLVAQGAGHDHDVRLPRAGTKDDAELVEIVAGHAGVHHFDGTACQAESHGPHRAGTGPVHDRVSAGRDEAFLQESVNSHGNFRETGMLTCKKPSFPVECAFFPFVDETH